MRSNHRAQGERSCRHWQNYSTISFVPIGSPNGREYTHREVCAALDGALEPSHLGKLRNGAIANPKRDTLILLCRFFQVPPSYFFPDFPPDGAGEETDGDPIGAAMRVLDLPPEARRALETFLRTVQRR